MQIILASSSPRRKKLMEEISKDFLIDVSDVDESINKKMSPEDMVQALSIRKGEVVHNRHYEDIVISADTVVAFKGEIIGKPKDEADARRILRLLSGEKHEVYTGVSLFYKEYRHTFYVETLVYFNDLSDELINNYVATGSPLDKAGAYGIQDNDSFPLVNRIEGDLDNVIGFPVNDIKTHLRDFIADISV